MNIIIFTDVNGMVGFGRYAGTYRIATELRQNGYTVQVVEYFAELSLEDLKKICDKYVDNTTLMVAFSTSLLIRKTNGDILSRIDRSEENIESNHLPQDAIFIQEMFTIFKSANPNLKIVMGGTRTDFTFLKGVDYWMWGMGDKSIIALATHLKSKKKLKTKEGIVGKVITEKDYPYTNFSNSKIIWEDNDFLFDKEHLPIEIARGCIFHCDFCAYPLHKKRGQYEKKEKILREEFLYNYYKYGTKGYMFCDDTFNDSKEKVEKYSKLFNSLPFQLEWSGFGRIDVIHFHIEQRELLLESGLSSMLFGIETLNAKASKVVGKGLHPEKTKETLYYLKEKWKNKINISASFIVGLPWESEDSVYETVEWLLEKDCPIDNASFCPLNIRIKTDNPYTPLSKIALNPKKYGYFLDENKKRKGISTSGPYWINEYMDKTSAEEITRNIQRQLKKKNSIIDWATYTRMRNLGYSKEQLLNSNTNTFRDMNMRKENMKKEYLNKLLSY